MRVLMIAPEPFFEPRGTPISVYQRLRGLSDLGHQVDLLTYHVGTEVRLRGVEIRRIPSVPFVRRVKIGPSLAKLFLDILLFWKAVCLLSRNDYEAIHSHEEAAFFSVALATFFHVRHLYDMHSSLPQQLRNYGAKRWLPFVKLFEVLERRVLSTCDAVITVGSDLEQYVREINPGAVEVMIENLPLRPSDLFGRAVRFQDLVQEQGLTNRLPIVYTGTFERYQGLDLVLQSAQVVVEHHPEVCFVLVGGRDDQVDRWRKEAEKLHLGSYTRFVGAVQPLVALAYLEVAEILLSPRIDGTSVPLKIYSYLHSGKPIVATDVPAHRQLLSDDTALLTAPTPSAFAAGILKLVEDPQARLSLGRRGRAFSDGALDPTDYQAKLEQVYQMLVSIPRKMGRLTLGSGCLSARTERK